MKPHVSLPGFDFDEGESVPMIPPNSAKTTSLATYLLAQIAADEADIMRGGRHNAPGTFANDNYGCLLVDPAHVLATCAAHRAIVEQATATAACGGHDPAFYESFERDYAMPAVRHLPAGYAPGCDGCASVESVATQDRIYLSLLATIYADREGFDPAWVAS